MEKIKALVVDDNMEFTNNVVKYFSNSENIRVVQQINNGSKVIEYLKENPDIDIIFLDLIMPGMDGIAILQEMAQNNMSQKVIVLSSYLEDYSLRMLKKYKVDYFMLKPIDLKSLEQRVLEIMEVQSKFTVIKEVDQNLEIQTSQLLHNLGVPSQIKGYQYLREGILLLYRNTDFIGGITSVLYPEIAKRHNTTPTRVERAIRHAIEISWNRGDYQIMNKLFGNSIDFDRSKPTNSEFLVTVSDALRLGSYMLNA